MEWSDQKQRFDPLNEHVKLQDGTRQQIRARLHAEIDTVTSLQVDHRPDAETDHQPYHESHQPTDAQDGSESPTSPTARRYQKKRRRGMAFGSIGVGAMVAAAVVVFVVQATSAGHGSSSSSVATRYGVQHQSSASQSAQAAGNASSSGSTTSSSSASSSSTSSVSSGTSSANSSASANVTNQSKNGFVHSLAQMAQAPSATLDGINPIQMYGQYGWALTASGLQHTSDGGTTWTAAKPPVSGTRYGESATAVGGMTAEVAVGTVSGNKGVITVYRTSDGGQSWQSTQVLNTLPNDNAGQVPGKLVSAGPGASWLVTEVPDFGMGGTQPGGLYRTTDAGHTWSRVLTSGFANGSVPFSWLTFINSTVGFTEAAPQANADAGVTTGQYQVYRSTDGGQHWTALSIAVPKQAKRVDFQPPRFSGSTGYMTAIVWPQTGMEKLLLFKSTDSGATWQKPSTLVASSANANYGPVLSVRAGSVWVCWDGYLWVSADGAHTWQKVTVPKLQATNTAEASTVVSELDMSGVQSGYAVTVEPLKGKGGAQHTLWKTADGGKTWQMVGHLH